MRSPVPHHAQQEVGEALLNDFGQRNGQGSSDNLPVLASHAAVYNTFNVQPHLISRPGLRTLRAEAHRAWAAATAAA